MVLRLVPFIIMSDDATSQQRWHPQPNIVLHKALWENHEKIYKSGNYLLNWNQTLVEWFLVGSLSEFCRWPHRQPRWPPQPNLVLRNLWKKSSWLDLLPPLALYLVEMVPRRTSIRILSVDHIRQPRQLNMM